MWSSSSRLVLDEDFVGLLLCFLRVVWVVEGAKMDFVGGLTECLRG